MNQTTPEITAAKNLTEQVQSLLVNSPSFQELDSNTQQAIRNDLSKIKQAFQPQSQSQYLPEDDPYALTLETPEDLRRRRNQASFGGSRVNTSETPSPRTDPASNAGKKVAATETLASRAGALSDEIDFPAFVASLIQGTFDALVDANIRQLEAYAELVSSVAKSVDQFTRENVTPNQVRDWLIEQYPNDLELELPLVNEGGQPRLRRRKQSNDAEQSPAWLQDFGLAGEELEDEFIEQHLVPAARLVYGEKRLQMLATMVLMGMNRININDGTLSARVRFRAAARDRAAVDYATSHDPGKPSWGSRGSQRYEQHTTMVSTIGANVQADSSLKVELFGEVKINFVSETVPLERFVDAATTSLLQSNARAASNSNEPPTASLPAVDNSELSAPVVNSEPPKEGQ